MEYIKGQILLSKEQKRYLKNKDLRKFANTVTDIAGRANVLIQGGDIDIMHVIIGGVKHYL